MHVVSASAAVIPAAVIPTTIIPTTIVPTPIIPATVIPAAIVPMPSSPTDDPSPVAPPPPLQRRRIRCVPKDGDILRFSAQGSGARLCGNQDAGQRSDEQQGCQNLLHQMLLKRSLLTCLYLVRFSDARQGFHGNFAHDLSGTDGP
jgi:hypothetical protein